MTPHPPEEIEDNELAYRIAREVKCNNCGAVFPDTYAATHRCGPDDACTKLLLTLIEEVEK